MLNVKCNQSQLGQGQLVVKDINNAIDSYETDLDSSIKNIKSAALKYRVNLENTIIISGLQEDFANLRNGLKDINNLAERQYEIVDAYQKGDLELNSKQFGLTEDAYFLNLLTSASNKINPDTLTKVGATAAMGIFKFTEGFLEFFEDIGDAAITLSAGAASILGQDKVAKSWQQFAEKDLAVNLVENNKTFEWINKNSYFDKDSTYAKAFKIGGKVTGALVTGKVVSVTYASRVTKITEAMPTVSKVSTKATKISGLISTQGGNVTSNLKQGHGIKTALAIGSAESAMTLGISKGISNPIGNKMGDKISTTGLGQLIQKGDAKASEIFSNETKEMASKTTGVVVDTSIKTGKKETTGDLISNDGNEQSKGDYVAEQTANTTIDTLKKTGEKTITKSAAKTAAKSVGNVVIKSIP